MPPPPAPQPRTGRVARGQIRDGKIAAVASFDSGASLPSQVVESQEEDAEGELAQRDAMAEQLPGKFAATPRSPG